MNPIPRRGAWPSGARSWSASSTTTPTRNMSVNAQQGTSWTWLKGSGLELAVRPCNRTSDDFIEEMRAFVQRQKLFGVILFPSVSEDERLAELLQSLGLSLQWCGSPQDCRWTKGRQHAGDQRRPGRGSRRRGTWRTRGHRRIGPHITGPLFVPFGARTAPGVRRRPGHERGYHSSTSTPGCRRALLYLRDPAWPAPVSYWPRRPVRRRFSPATTRWRWASIQAASRTWSLEHPR